MVCGSRPSGLMLRADCWVLMYIEFHSKSAFSFLEGSSLPESLIARCAELQMPAMALLDRDGVYGAPRFHMAAKKAKIKAHLGAEVTCDFSPRRHGGTEKTFEKQSLNFQQEQRIHATNCVPS